MQEDNKKNLIFIAVIAFAALTVFSTVILCYSYVGEGWWTMPLPLAAIGYGIFALVKKYLPKKS